MILAGGINQHHAEVGRHAKGMLLAAKAAGELLLQAKGRMNHGEFQAWVKDNCACSYPMAKKYMQVAKLSADKRITRYPFDQFDSIRAFLDAHAEHKENPKTSPNATLTTRQVQKVKKLHALATSTVNAEEAAGKTLVDKRFDGGIDALLGYTKENPRPSPQRTPYSPPIICR